MSKLPNKGACELIAVSEFVIKSAYVLIAVSQLVRVHV